MPQMSSMFWIFLFGLIFFLFLVLVILLYYSPLNLNYLSTRLESDKFNLSFK